MASTKMFVHYSGTVADFKKLSNLSDYEKKIVFIKGGADGKGAAIYTHGSYFANFAEFLAAVNYVKGVKVGNSEYIAAQGGGYIPFAADGTATVALNVNNGTITVGLTEAFVNRVGSLETDLGSKNDAADAAGSAFARIAALAEAIGTNGSVAGQITAAINALRTEIVGTLGADDAATLAAINDELDAIDAKWASYVSKAELEAIEDTKANGTNVNVSVTTKGGKVTAVAVNETGLNTALGLKANAADVYTKTDADAMAQGKVDALANGAVKANADAIATLNGNTSVDGSVDKKIQDAINAFAGSANGDNVIENVTELLAYVSKVDGSKDLSVAIAQIADNKGKIETLNGNESTAGSVAKVVKDASDSIKTEVQGIIAENERVTAEAYTNLDTRVIALESKNATIDSALQSADITTGSANGTIAVKGSDVAVKGLGSAAFTDAGAYATAAQGSKADSALQEIEAVGGDYITLTDSAKSANKQTVTASVAVKAVASATAAKQGLADSYDVNQEIAGAKAYADALFAWEEF